MKKVLEQKQVVDMAMIPSKEARELLYSLLAENFISLQVSPRVFAGWFLRFPENPSQSIADFCTLIMHLFACIICALYN